MILIASTMSPVNIGKDFSGLKSVRRTKRLIKEQRRKKECRRYRQRKQHNITSRRHLVIIRESEGL
jgi:hypothetical protein